MLASRSNRKRIAAQRPQHGKEPPTGRGIGGLDAVEQALERNGGAGGKAHHRMHGGDARTGLKCWPQQRGFTRTTRMQHDLAAQIRLPAHQLRARCFNGVVGHAEPEKFGVEGGFVPGSGGGSDGQAAARLASAQAGGGRPRAHHHLAQREAILRPQTQGGMGQCGAPVAEADDGQGPARCCRQRRRGCVRFPHDFARLRRHGSS